MTTPEEQDSLRLLVQHVARAFYESKFVIILDQLSRHPVLKDEDLAGRMGLQPKELNKLIAILHNDALVRVHRQNELKEGAQRVVPRQYYYIDYEHFCNVVKWRIAAMRRQIDDKLRNSLENKGYICIQCRAQYSPLDADKLFTADFSSMQCETCTGEVVENENAANVLGSKDRMQRFNHQIRFIREGLQKSEFMVLPAFDVVAWVLAHSANANQNSDNSPGAGLKIAGSDPNGRLEDDGIGVLISTDTDEATRRKLRQELAEAKRAQNQLPAWHLRSTISNDLTALGVKENARIAAAAEVSGALITMSNDDQLKGLGVVGGSSNRLDAQSFESHNEDVKPIITTHETDYYDQYYASLQHTPMPTPMVDARLSDSSSDDEDSLQTSTISLKRSHSDMGDDNLTSSRIKTPRMAGDQYGITAGSNWATETPPASQEDLAAMAEDTIDGVEEELEVDMKDDPIVSVNGLMIPFSQVTEEHHELMTPDEYTQFFEIISSRDS